ncbi:response regulator [Streptomyces clavuligerus]|uniref:Putative two-component system response regulator n=1 Tax=Streptomyces clavuligerus TaxID=1901 RepID=B5GTJ8_STRCL|nr:response regulator transcription factor [Streptomyces clavuligerus]EDY49644.1 two component response regulator MppU [Streptomyces clavuligerus]EFG04069.1 putative two-component system response regulator [Streptomyces clavuligerus]MBY6307442.1 response regulator transcription factor [Streptomyces clavuligerus]QCS09997.1 DNA-binding response regulator [Streptomyces clavuligerus]QPJ97959.1 response regulator [Streptomyces clavuligerus]
MTARILIADDQDDIRSGFRLVLDSQPDLTVVGEAADGLTAVALARELRPDLVVADIRMPGVDGLEVTRRLAGPDADDPVRVLIVTTFDQDDHVRTALRDGACGFLLKRSGPGLLIEGVRAALAGDVLISPQLTARLLQRATAPDDRRTSPLTAREEEIARLVADGLTNAEIGEALVISPGTAKTHVANVQTKLGARNRVGIAAWWWGRR